MSQSIAFNLPHWSRISLCIHKYKYKILYKIILLYVYKFCCWSSENIFRSLDLYIAFINLVQIININIIVDFFITNILAILQSRSSKHQKIFISNKSLDRNLHVHMYGSIYLMKFTEGIEFVRVESNIFYIGYVESWISIQVWCVCVNWYNVIQWRRRSALERHEHMPTRAYLSTTQRRITVTVTECMD